MPDYQRIHVVSTLAAADEVADLRRRLGKEAVVLTAPTGEAKQVVKGLGRTPVPEVLLAPVAHPTHDRGHRLDGLVRRHALADRYRDVVVVADPASITLLLRVLAPGQLATGGAVVEAGLPRGPRPVSLVRVLAGGVGLAVAFGLGAVLGTGWVLPALVVLAGLVLLVLPSQRHLGKTVLLAVAVAGVVMFMAIAGSERFPGGR